MTRSLLRSALLSIAVTAGGCGFTFPELPGSDGDGDGDGDGETGDSSTSGDASATSTTGRPPATSSTTLDSSTTVGDSGSTDVGDDTGITFIPEPPCGGTSDDGFGVRCQPVECSVAAQDCLEGEKCVPWANDGGDAWNATRCAPVPADPAGVGEPCVAEGSPVSGLDDCDLGALCFGVDPRTLQGTCTALCDGDDPAACPDAEVCVADNAYAPQVCVPRCDPTEPDPCAAGESCRPIGDEILCVPTVTLPQGLSCGPSDRYCAVEQACVPDEALTECAETACCTAWCDLLAIDPDLPCAAVPGEVCRPYFEPAPAGQERVGVCALPG